MDCIDAIDTACDQFLKEAKKPWSKRPPGWKKPKTIKKYWKTLTKGDKKHPFTECVKRMKKHMDSPEGFCASTKDIAKGTTKWRNPPKKKKKKKNESKSK